MFWGSRKHHLKRPTLTSNCRGKSLSFVCAPAFPNVVHPEFRAFIPNEISKYKFAAFSARVSQRAQHGILMQAYFHNGPARQSAFSRSFFQCLAMLAAWLLILQNVTTNYQAHFSGTTSGTATGIFSGTYMQMDSSRVGDLPTRLDHPNHYSTCNHPHPPPFQDAILGSWASIIKRTKSPAIQESFLEMTRDQEICASNSFFVFFNISKKNYSRLISKTKMARDQDIYSLNHIKILLHLLILPEHHSFSKLFKFPKQNNETFYSNWDLYILFMNVGFTQIF